MTDDQDYGWATIDPPPSKLVQHGARGGKLTLEGLSVAHERWQRWTLKRKDGSLSKVFISNSKRELERKLVPQYVGAEWSWSRSYQRHFEEDLERYLREENVEIVEVEMTLTAVRR